VREATVRDVNGDVLVLVFKHRFHADALTASPGLLQDALYEVLGGRWRISAEVAGQSTTSASRPTSAAAPARPAPAAAPRQAPAAPTTPAAPVVEEDWPETAPLGGSGADGGVVAPVVPAAPPVRTPPARPSARPAGNEEAWAGEDEPPFDPEFDGPIGALAAPSPSAAPAPAPAKSATPPASAQVTPTQAMPATATATSGHEHVGFDPGDEPVDDAVDPADRQSTEQQALDLLRETLGAEKIPGP
jgi:DNA polymerase-3 subunit gamma/tau